MKRSRTDIPSDVYVLIAIDDDYRVRECIVVTSLLLATELRDKLRTIWGGEKVCMASRSVDNVPHQSRTIRSIVTVFQERRMTTMNTDEREQRLRQIRDWKQTWLALEGYAPKDFKKDALEHIDFLLSLLDSQAAGGDTSNLLRRLKDFLFDNCDHNERDRNYDWCPSCVMAFMEVVSKPGDCDATIAMRARCVEKVKAMRDEWWRRASIGPTVEFAKKRIRADAADDIVKELESLTLEQGEQEKR